MISQKARLLQSIEGKPVDRPPVVCPGGMMNMMIEDLMRISSIYLPEAHSDARLMVDLTKAVVEQGCFENYGLPYCMTVESENLGSVVDMGSTIYEPHVVEYQLKTVSDWKSLPALDVNKGRAKIVLDAIRLLKAESDEIPIIGNITGPISFGSSLMEPVDFYKEMRKKREEMHKFLEFLTDQLIAFSIAQIEAGADIIAISDPSGTGEILGPKPFEEFLVKNMNRLLDAIREAGAYSMVHICGQMRNVYREVNQLTADVLSFDSMVNYKEASAKLEGRVLMGNVSTFTLEFGEPELVQRLTKSCIKNGASILSPACGIGMRSPIENIRSILEVVK